MLSVIYTDTIHIRLVSSPILSPLLIYILYFLQSPHKIHLQNMSTDIAAFVPRYGKPRPVSEVRWRIWRMKDTAEMEHGGRAPVRRVSF